jgi:GTP-binding protein
MALFKRFLYIIEMQDPKKIRNIAIIAHVDHGKTTLVDGLLKQSNTFRDNQAEMNQDLIMDSGDQEKERGITITAKVTSVTHDGYRINIIDTPGHADFSGEVERTLSMADGCLLVVDAQEGPMPQTKFVLKKALENNLKPIVLINKIDKTGSQIARTEEELGDLFLELAVSDEQLNYPTYYGVSREGKAWDNPPTNISDAANLDVVFKAIINSVPAPRVNLEQPFQMMVTALAWDTFKGKYAIGRIKNGMIKPNTEVAICKKDGSIKKGKIEAIFTSNGLGRAQVEQGVAGDIVQLTGISDVQIGETIADKDQPNALPVLQVEEPTLEIYLGPNTSPSKGQEGDYTTSRQIKDRLDKELETNVGLKVKPNDVGFLVSGRGELHLSVLLETMRREGFEMEVGRPQVVTKLIDGKENEPIEELSIEVPTEYVGQVQIELGKRKATLIKQHQKSSDQTELIYEIPTRATLGLRSLLVTGTKGTVIMNSLITGYKPMGESLKQDRNGVLIAWENGTATPYALQTAEERGTCFIKPGDKIYSGQIIGLNRRGEDMEINVCKEKHLTNMRSKSSDGTIQLTTATTLSLEQALDFIENDELLELTPKSLRLRKKVLDHNLRKKKQ